MRCSGLLCNITCIKKERLELAGQFNKEPRSENLRTNLDNDQWNLVESNK